VCRELKRNASPQGYSVDFADKAAKERQAKVRRVPKKMTEDLKNDVIGALQKGGSPEAFCGRRKLEKLATFVNFEPVYRFVRQNREQGGTLYKHLRHKGKKYRYKGQKQAGIRLIPHRVDISQRPTLVEEKSRIGDGEGDTVMSAKSKTALVTLVVRHSKYLCVAKLGRRTAQKTRLTVIDLLKSLKRIPVHTLTFDNGLEFSEHEKMTEALGAKVFFARPYRSCERGLNEPTNGLIREYLPKHEDFRDVSATKIKKMARILNTRPRKSLNFLTPDEVLFSYKGRFFE
jgi:IS30 family transposase